MPEPIPDPPALASLVPYAGRERMRWGGDGHACYFEVGLKPLPSLEPPRPRSKFWRDPFMANVPPRAYGAFGSHFADMVVLTGAGR